MSAPRSLTGHISETREVTFPGGYIRLDISNVPLDDLSERDRDFLADLRTLMAKLGHGGETPS